MNIVCLNLKNVCLCRVRILLLISILFVSVGMYIAHFDAVYLTKRSIYLIMAVIGLINWAKLNKTRNIVNE